jgi:hypothetical protein
VLSKDEYKSFANAFACASVKLVPEGFIIALVVLAGKDVTCVAVEAAVATNVCVDFNND